MKLILSFVTAIVVWAPMIGGRAEANDAEDVQKKIEKSVVYLQFWTSGDQKSAKSPVPGTGFVVADNRQRKWIATTAHSLAPTSSGQRIVSIKYRQFGAQQHAECEGVIVDEKHDIAMLEPHSQYPLIGEPLRVVGDASSNLNTLFAVGSTYALDLWPRKNDGIAQVLTIGEWAKKLPGIATKFAPLASDTTLVRHGILVALGYSGCPIVTSEGRVAGIQSSVIRDAPIIGFAIHHRHIKEFDWTQPREALTTIDIAKWSADGVLKRTSAGEIPFNTNGDAASQQKKLVPATIKLSGVDVAAPFIHHGYVERDAVSVIDKYIQDNNWYQDKSHGKMRTKRLQEVLNRTRLVRISNPLLGIQMLVPEGYRYGWVPTTKPNGLLLTFQSPDDRNLVPPFDTALSVWTTVESELYRQARERSIKHLMKEAVKIDLNDEKEVERLMHGHRMYMNGFVGSAISIRFAAIHLGIRVRDTSGKVYGKENAELFDLSTFGGTHWSVVNYDSTTTKLGHFLKFGNREPLAVLVHTKYSQDQSKAFYAENGTPDPTFSEFIVLASSVSTAADRD